MSRDVSILYMYIHLFVQILYHAFLLDLQETHQQDVISIEIKLTQGTSSLVYFLGGRCQQATLSTIAWSLRGNTTPSS